MTAPERTESPTEGTAGLLERLLTDEYGDQGWNDLGSLRRIARVLDAHVTERCAETLEEAAATFQMNTWADVVTPALRTKGIPALAVGQAVVDWLRDRAAAMRGEGARG